MGQDTNNGSTMPGVLEMTGMMLEPSGKLCMAPPRPTPPPPPATLDPLARLLAEGATALTAQRDRKRDEREREVAQRRLIVCRKWQPLEDAVRMAVGYRCLQETIDFRRSEWELAPDVRTHSVTINVPGCVAVWLHFDRQDESGVWAAKEWLNRPAHEEPLLYSVPMPTRPPHPDSELFSDLGMALARAREIHQHRELLEQAGLEDEDSGEVLEPTLIHEPTTGERLLEAIDKHLASRYAEFLRTEE